MAAKTPLITALCKGRGTARCGPLERHCIGRLDMKWEVIHIPGHSMGSIALYNPAKEILIPGDVVYADYAIGRFDLYRANAGDLKKSLMKLAEMKVEMLLPGHNRTVTKVQPDYILKTAKQWESYLE